MDGEEEAFWGRATKGPDPGAKKAAPARNEVIGVVAPKLAPNERVMVALRHERSIWEFGRRRAIAVTWERVFIVEWDRRGRYEITQVADRWDVSAEFVGGGGDESDEVVIRGPWGKTKFNVVSETSAGPILDVLGPPSSPRMLRMLRHLADELASDLVPGRSDDRGTGLRTLADCAGWDATLLRRAATGIAHGEHPGIEVLFEAAEFARDELEGRADTY